MNERELSDTLEDQREPGSSHAVLEAITQAEKAFDPYMRYCRSVDKVYSLSLTSASLDTYDETFALFWASMEILKPAIYAKPPRPIASPRFKDGGKLEKTTAELVERCLESTFDRGGIDEVMLGVRDDLALTNRGVAWVTYETDKEGGGQRVCIEHLDRADFLHEPARKWSEVGWVARRAWMTLTEMKKRFAKLTDEELRGANYSDRKDKDDYGMHDNSAKAGVWEVWSKADNRVYWATEGVRKLLDEGKPHLSLNGFFPCPRPAYGTLQRRSLVPVPDYKRYQYHLDQINKLTERIYVLLERVKLKVLIPAGGDVADAVQAALDSTDDSITIPVPAAALSAAGQQNYFITLPLADIATTIQGLIEARTQLINDFYQLSGISDIMRGATQAQETLGAQQLKSQYGSVRVRDKIDELQRIARDVAAISAEIMSVNFSKETLLDLSQMKIASKADLEKQIKAVPGKAEEEVKALRKSIEDAADAQTTPIDPEQVQSQFMEQKAKIVQKYDMMLQELTASIAMDDVMKILRDSKGRSLLIDIETDSTILTDEIAEKQSRAEFLNAFSNATASTQALLMAGEPGAKLAGGILKFALQPYRANRELDALVDDFVENYQPPAQQGDGMAEANAKIAEAELMKAQAQGQNYAAQAQLKMQDLTLKAAEAQEGANQDRQRFQLEIAETKASLEETAARTNYLYAQIEALGLKGQIDTGKLNLEQQREQREDVKTVAQIQGQQRDHEMQAENAEREAEFRERGEGRADRQQEMSEQQALIQKEPV